MSKMILVAATELSGGTVAKGGVKHPFVLAKGKQLTSEAVKSLGLDKTELTDLIARGHVVEAHAHVAEGGTGETAVLEAHIKTLEDQLETEKQRADTAEAALKTANDELATLKAAS